MATSAAGGGATFALYEPNFTYPQTTIVRIFEDISWILMTSFENTKSRNETRSCIIFNICRYFAPIRFHTKNKKKCKLFRIYLYISTNECNIGWIEYDSQTTNKIIFPTSFQNEYIFLYLRSSILLTTPQESRLTKKKKSWRNENLKKVQFFVVVKIKPVSIPFASNVPSEKSNFMYIFL